MNSVLLIGLGRFGRHVAMNLHEMGQEVLAVDMVEERVNEVMTYVTGAQIGDSTNPIFLESLGVSNFDACIVAIGDCFQSSLETTSLLKELGAKKVVSRAATDIQEKFLLRNGADEVVYPEKQLAKWTAICYSSEKILNYVDLEGSLAIYEVKIPKTWANRTVLELDVRRRYGINILAVRQDGRLDHCVSPEMLLPAGGTLMVMGEEQDIQKALRHV